MRQIALSLLVLMSFAANADAADLSKSRIGEEIADFTLRDYHGREVSLSDFDDAKVVVVAFLGTDCPLVKLYGPRLDELSKKFAEQGVAVIGINSNRQDQPRKIAAFRSEEHTSELQSH